ncbi:hypothetical protein ACUXSI_001107 [Staphylococcus hominis]
MLSRNYNKDVSISVHGAGPSRDTNTVLIGDKDENLFN